jgi:hypothetical protein
MHDILLPCFARMQTHYSYMLFKERMNIERFRFTLFCSHALRPSLHSEEGCQTSSVEMSAIDSSYQVRHVKGSVATSMTEP